MKRTLIAVVTGFLLAGGGVAFADGAKVFNAKCASCHGKDGKGETAMGKKKGVKDLAASKIADAEIIAIINDGKKLADGKEGSPAFKGKIADPEIKEVADYVKTFRK